MNAVIGLVLRILLMVALYGFLGAALWLIWKSVVSKSTRVDKEVTPPISLSSTLEGTKQDQVFTTSEVVIGRDPDCDFVLPHTMVSTRHGRLSFHQNQWWYEDLKSTNGSFLEDLRIEEPIVLKDGDVIFCGEVDLTIKIKPNS
ncbi:MAG: FHA domain-containing protein [Anaerolineaceae bacterium]